MSPILPFNDLTPQLDETVFVAENAFITGDVNIGAQSSLFFGAAVRGDSGAIRIGERTNLQDNVVVHADEHAHATLGDGISVGHGAVVHGCTIEDDCLIGMNATVLNNAVVGRGSLVAAGALVLEGTEIPPGSLVAGVPAKVRRPLTEEEQAHIRENGAHYVDLASTYISTVQNTHATRR
ncbi:gamma carbonic anhydrase family protein [Haematomicrobium sanguinis]|uniref:gamma carbonic anhydrase family protein n=1 Tax=Haematomicrobium sanguinis TaxID=479106 RepID=UPI00047EEFEE|nr:gamma carbonic anhydrase family protein [Haematomicrobium sanguinis]